MWASSVVTNLSTSLPVESLTTNVAPANGKLVAWSTFVINTTTWIGVFSKVNLISLFLSVIVNLTGVVFNL